MMRDQIHRAQHHAWGAKTTLQPVAVLEGLLHGVQAAVWRGKALNRGDGPAIGLHGQHIATFDGSAIDQDRTCPALRSVTADMRAGQTERIAQILNQCGLGSHVVLDRSPIHFQCDGLGHEFILLFICCGKRALSNGEAPSGCKQRINSRACGDAGLCARTFVECLEKPVKVLLDMLSALLY